MKRTLLSVKELAQGIGHQYGLRVPSVSDGRNSRGTNRSHHPVRSGAGASGDGGESQSDAEQSVHEEARDRRRQPAARTRRNAPVR